MRLLLAAGLSTLLVPTFSAVAAVRYVNVALASGNNDGTSWANAYRGPQALKAGMDAAVSGGHRVDDVRV